MFFFHIIYFSLCNCSSLNCVCVFYHKIFLHNLHLCSFIFFTYIILIVFYNLGRPWMKGMLENHPLFLSVFVCVGGVIVASWEMAPQLNDMIQLAPFPDDNYRYKVVILVVSTIFGTFIWDRLCTMMFAPKVFKAMTVEASRTTIEDIKPVRMYLRSKFFFSSFLCYSTKPNIIIFSISFCTFYDICSLFFLIYSSLF